MKLTTPPTTAGTRIPFRGSRTRMARSAPTTAPKNEAAHARNGVSSHPKTRTRARSQRMLAASAPHAREDDGRGDAGEEPDAEGGKGPCGAWEMEQRSPHPERNAEHERREHEPHDGRGLTVGRLIREEPGTHPWEVGANHPPDGVVPPVAPTTELAPAIGVDPE